MLYAVALLLDVGAVEEGVGLVAAGLGISIVPRIPILETMEVETIPIKRPEIKRYIYLVTQKDKYLSPIVEDFIGFIKSRHQM